MKKTKNVSLLISIGILAILAVVLFLTINLSKFKRKLAEEDIKFKAKIAEIDSLLSTISDLSEKKEE